jgi:cytochrome c oxidase assembly factor 5
MRSAGNPSTRASANAFDLSESVRSRVIALPSPFTLEIAFPSATTTRSVDPHARNSSSVVNRFSDTSIARNRSQLSTPLSVVKPFARKSNRVNDAHDASARAAPIDVVANHRARSPDASARASSSSSSLKTLRDIALRDNTARRRMSKSCSGMLAEFLDCVESSACVKKHGHTLKQCASPTWTEHAPSECEVKRSNYFACRKGQLDMRARLRGNKGY